MMTRPEPWDMAIDELTRRIEALEDQVLPHPATIEQPCSHEWEDSVDVRTCRRCYITEEMPEPKWRRLVEEQRWRIPSDHPPLATVLHCLARIERGQAGDAHVLPVTDYLARIIAVCEAQVGDGWQAERSGAFGACMSVRCLMKEGWTPDGWPSWEGLGNAATSWLRDLTEDMPEPVPEWRRLVDKAEPQARGHQNPFGYVLLQLSDITTTQRYPHLGVAAESIARIIAVCEAQVGDGWQAEPRYVPHADDHDIRCLITVMGERDPWRALGNRAAAWLRDITEATP